MRKMKLVASGATIWLCFNDIFIIDDMGLVAIPFEIGFDIDVPVWGGFEDAFIAEEIDDFASEFGPRHRNPFWLHIDLRLYEED